MPYKQSSDFLRQTQHPENGPRPGLRPRSGFGRIYSFDPSRRFCQVQVAKRIPEVLGIPWKSDICLSLRQKKLKAPFWGPLFFPGRRKYGIRFLFDGHSGAAACPGAKRPSLFLLPRPHQQALPRKVDNKVAVLEKSRTRDRRRPVIDLQRLKHGEIADQEAPARP